MTDHPSEPPPPYTYAQLSSLLTSDSVTETTPSKVGGTVACRLSKKENQRLLVSWLARFGGSTVNTPPTECLTDDPFDIFIVDVPTLIEISDELVSYFTQNETGYIPCLLVTSEPTSGEDVVGRLPTVLRSLITEVITTPIRKSELAHRLVALFRIRRLSVELYVSREEYRRVLRLIPGAVTIVTNETIRYVNRSAVKLFKQTESALIGRSVRHLLGTDWERIQESLLSADIGEPTPFLSGISTVPNSTPVEVAAVQLGSSGDSIALVIRDVTEQHQREEQLRLYRRAMDDAKIGITITDATEPDNPLIYVNKELERLTGRNASDILGENPRIFQPPQTTSAIKSDLREAIANGEPINTVILNQRSDGTEWCNELDVSPVYYNTELRNFIGFQRDVTDERERNQQLAVLDRVLRHNFRNRLNVIIGHAEEIANSPSDTRDGTHAEAVLSAAYELLELSEEARQFRSAMHADEQSRTAVDLVRVVRTEIQELRGKFGEESGRVVTSFPNTAYIDSSESIRFAISELLTNAVTHSDHDTPRIEVTIEETAESIVLTITDDGPGIPVSEQSALVGADETPVNHASGLGLWLIRWSVASAGGHLTYTDAKPRGSCVRIELPHSTQTS